MIRFCSLLHLCSPLLRHEQNFPTFVSAHVHIPYPYLHHRFRGTCMFSFLVDIHFGFTLLVSCLGHTTYRLPPPCAHTCSGPCQCTYLLAIPPSFAITSVVSIPLFYLTFLLQPPHLLLADYMHIWAMLMGLPLHFYLHKDFLVHITFWVPVTLVWRYPACRFSQSIFLLF